MSFVLQDKTIDSPAALFTGDTLFIGGVGKFFEGSPEDARDTLFRVIGSLPDDTLVFCGHEYTVSNLEFAVIVDPENEDVKSKLAWAKARRADRKQTIPSTIGAERLHNPFLRAPKFSKRLFPDVDGDAAVAATLRALRCAKNKGGGQFLHT